MASTKLKEDLTNCLINFDRRVLITELLDEYQLPYEEVNNVVRDFVEQQEKKEKLKYDKRYIVHGVQEEENKKEIYKIVEEAKLKEWLKKLKNAESSLYSVEVAGGAKSAAPVFKPMRVLEGVKLKERKGTKAAPATNGTTGSSKPVEKKEVKLENGSTSKKLQESPKKALKETPKPQPSAKKTSPKTETSPTDKKVADKKPANKKGIANFFAPSAGSSKKAEDTKPASGVIKPPTPKKMEDFFKKQAEKPKTTTESIKKPAANTSVQLFDDDEEEEPEEVESSDEEEKIEALKRDIISSDVEMDNDEEEEDSKPSTSTKRRRILDSDDEEEDPPVKHEKLDIKEESKEEAEPADETYLDEDGFVITKKPKQKLTPPANKTPAAKKTPPVTLKTSPKDGGNKKSSSSSTTKAATNPAAKTKQAGIMNFFTKK